MSPLHLSDRESEMLVNGDPGGYWRYPIVEHVLTYNVHFPPEQLLEEIRTRLRSLIACYPATQDRLADHLGVLVGRNPDWIVVGNGTVELMQLLISGSGLRLAVPTPSFGIYESAAGPERHVKVPLRPPFFEVDLDELFHVVNSSDLDAAVIISPNNPTSRAIPRADLVSLAQRLQRKGKKLLLDESFVEFTYEGSSNSLESDLNILPNVIVIKSLGKIYGVCGLRLGYMMSSDKLLISAIRGQVPLWNINAISEYMLVNVPRYREQFESSCEVVKQERNQLYAQLEAIKGGCALRPDANFVFFRLPDQWPDGPALARLVLAQRHILLRHCGSKSMEHGIRYLRIAARSSRENEDVVSALLDAAGSMRRSAPQRAGNCSGPSCVGVRPGTVSGRLRWPGGQICG